MGGTPHNECRQDMLSLGQIASPEPVQQCVFSRSVVFWGFPSRAVCEKFSSFFQFFWLWAIFFWLENRLIGNWFRFPVRIVLLSEWEIEEKSPEKVFLKIGSDFPQVKEKVGGKIYASILQRLARPRKGSSSGRSVFWCWRLSPQQDSCNI